MVDAADAADAVPDAFAGSTLDRQAIAAFKHEAARGQDANVKAYASQMIPVLEKQLHLAEEYMKPARHT